MSFGSISIKSLKLAEEVAEKGEASASYCIHGGDGEPHRRLLLSVLKGCAETQLYDQDVCASMSVWRGVRFFWKVQRCYALGYFLF